jgi:hypothetical protein
VVKPSSLIVAAIYCSVLFGCKQPFIGTPNLSVTQTYCDNPHKNIPNEPLLTGCILLENQDERQIVIQGIRLNNDFYVYDKAKAIKKRSDTIETGGNVGYFIRAFKKKVGGSFERLNAKVVIITLETDLGTQKFRLDRSEELSKATLFTDAVYKHYFKEDN